MQQLPFPIATPQSIAHEPLTLHEIHDFYTPPLYQQPKVIIATSIVVILLGIGLYYLIRFIRQRTLLPHEWAYQELKKLQQRPAQSSSDMKYFYYRLTRLIKEYLYKQYGLNVLSKTDDELIEYLADKQFSLARIEELKLILGNALLVKFANEQLIKTHVDADIERTRHFIEATIPNDSQKQRIFS